MSRDKPGLQAAYALKTPQDNLRLYADWATTYDETFAQAMDFLMPEHVARLYRENGGGSPVLDAGAGTGLVAEAIVQRGACVIDAFDLSAEMLEVAGAKGLYRHTIQGDLTEPLPFEDASYGAVVSSGTFTHGHVGPEAIDGLLRVARPGALFVLSIKSEHYRSKGFADRFDSHGDTIRDLALHDLPIYGDKACHEHARDTGLIAVFTRA